MELVRGGRGMGGGHGEQAALAGDRESGSGAARWRAWESAEKTQNRKRQQERGGGVLGLYDERARGGTVVYAQKTLDIE
jgi:hypothetical protein